MPKYLIKANYTLEGLKGVRAKGARSRADVVDNMVNGMGGTVESFYFAFGDADVYGVADLPDDESAAAVAFTVSASGGASYGPSTAPSVSSARCGPIGLCTRIGCRPSVEACSGALTHGKRLICPST